MSVNTHNQALKSADGSMWIWGQGTSGQIGNNSNTARSSPISVVGAHSFTIIGLGNQHSLGTKGDGTTWAWGGGGNGRLGIGVDTNNRSSPVSVVGNHTFTAITGGNSFSAGLKGSDGTAWSWGTALTGILGDNQTTVNRSSPVSVIGAHSFTAIAAGAQHTMALKSAGSVWAWGLGTSGQLGDNQTAVSRSSPVSVVSTNVYTAITAGQTSSAALKNDATAWSWGSNAGGQLGDGTATTQSTPVAVLGSHSFTQIVMGGSHTVAMKAAGDTWAWGLASSGQVGDNQVAANRSSPVSVIGGHSFIKIGAGQLNSYGLKNDGSVWAWGDASVGGDGDNQTAVNRSSPVLVVQPTSNVKTVQGMFYGKNVYNDIGTGKGTLNTAKTVNLVNVSQTKTIQGLT